MLSQRASGGDGNPATEQGSERGHVRPASWPVAEAWILTSYDYEAAMPGDPLISWKRTPQRAVGTVFFLEFGADSEFYGSKIGAP